ncbi:MAG: metallophosphoesterase [bacterium]|nr:metallophosphoesterase [bacterium]
MGRKVIRGVVTGVILIELVSTGGCAGRPRGVGERSCACGERMQFVIMPDRTGGERRGVFERAVEQVNLLRPQFVVCVGDMIEGYSEDSRVISAQFAEFEELVKKLDAPFYYVPGNHDISNPRMAKMWEERYGPRYYYFLRDDVLFICLNTEEGMEPGGMEKQVAQVCRTLGANSGVRFTFVFLHKPVWTWERVPEWWERIEDALADRAYAVFAGHDHTYRKFVRHGRPYYALATCGGWSHLDGLYAGLFDHITHVTLEGTNVWVVNFCVDGIVADDVVTEETLATGGKLGREGIFARPIFYTGPVFRAGELRVSFSNCLSMPVEMEVRVRSEGHVVADAWRDRVELYPGETTERVVLVEGRMGAIGDVAGVVVVEWQARCEPYRGKAFYTQGRTRAGVVRAQMASRVTHDVRIDGCLEDWASLPFTCTSRTYAVLEPGTWFGPDDGSFEFGVRYDDGYVYIGVRVTDEAVWVSPDVAASQQDGVEVWLHADPWEREALLEGGVGLIVGGQGGTNNYVICGETNRVSGVATACRIEAGGYTVECAVPLSALGLTNGQEWSELAVNVGLNDFDPPGPRGVQLWWQPDPRSREWFAGAGTVRKERE